jgi:hypothetical protein
MNVKPNTRCWAWAVVTIIIGTVAIVQGEILYSVSWSLDPSYPASSLWRHDIPVTPGEHVGSTGRYGVWGLAVEPGTARILATAPTSIYAPVSGDDLLLLDATNGTASVVAQLFWQHDSTPVPVVGMLAFASDGTLYGVSYIPDLDSGNDHLAVIDAATGLVTKKANPLGAAVNGGDLSFAADGTMMGIMTVVTAASEEEGEGEEGEPSAPVQVPALFLVNRVSGEASYVHDIWPSAYSNCPGLAHLTDGTMVSAGVVNLDEEGNQTDGFVFMIDPTDGHAEPISTKGYNQNVGDFAAMRTPTLTRWLWREIFP